MSTIDLPNEIAERLAAEAERRGVTIPELLADAFPRLDEAGRRVQPRRLRMIAAGSSSSGRRAADHDDMLAEGFGRS